MMVLFSLQAHGQHREASKALEPDLGPGPEQHGVMLGERQLLLGALILRAVFGAPLRKGPSVFLETHLIQIADHTVRPPDRKWSHSRGSIIISKIVEFGKCFCEKYQRWYSNSRS